MTTRTERLRQFGQAQRRAMLQAIIGHSDQSQLRERAATLARHGNTDQQIARELGQSVETVRRWLSPRTA
jgi:DNA-binding NarL/FixJ family response regulator